jgi:two-component system, chemotaxis family, chemotaxis protein CheY
MKVLVVDDNERMRRTIKSVVEDISDEYLECDDGADALRLYELNRPDWVTMDLRMKNVGGLEATRQIKEHFPEANVVIVTEFDDAELRKDAEQAGASGYVVKRELFDLRKILTGRQ